MAKFSFADAADEEPRATAADRKDKRKHDGGRGPGDGAAGGGPDSKARKLAAAGDGREARRVGGNSDAGISTRIDPDLLDYSVCFEPLCPPLYQVIARGDNQLSWTTIPRAYKNESSIDAATQ